MRALFYTCGSGISGDMNIGALIDIGVPAEFLSAELSKLALDREFRLDVRRDQKMGVWGTRAEVVLAGADRRLIDRHGHHLDHDGHRHADRRSDSTSHDHDHHASAPHRSYRDILAIVADAPFSDAVKAHVRNVFTSIGEAEAKIHDKTLDDIHFHEVGATDSIVDIFAAAIALDYLQVDTVLCSAVELGAGHVRCAHGIFPVPAPATAEILRGVPCTFGSVQGEATTPTGAAILKTMVAEFEPAGTFIPDRVGYGIGHNDFAIPNVLRTMIGDYRGGNRRTAALPDADNYEIVTNLDDMSPEAFGPLQESLFGGGASDVFLTPIVMKKNRLAQMITVLCRAADRDTLIDILLEESSTIGVRIRPVYKRMLDRTMLTVATARGAVGVKAVTLPSGNRRWKVEHDDIVRLAAAQGLSYAAVRTAVERDVANALAAGA